MKYLLCVFVLIAGSCAFAQDDKGLLNPDTNDALPSSHPVLNAAAEDVPTETHSRQRRSFFVPRVVPRVVPLPRPITRPQLVPPPIPPKKINPKDYLVRRSVPDVEKVLNADIEGPISDTNSGQGEAFVPPVGPPKKENSPNHVVRRSPLYIPERHPYPRPGYPTFPRRPPPRPLPWKYLNMTESEAWTCALDSFFGYEPESAFL
ncbi:uncharacterized protein LOC135398166 [Ornithodoros turicata]|uniref:uncharacterized protein LOC135398166 n=1 Tax=Ornithodoros turicata TaxID=34597 RepID=UPI003139E76A